MASGTRAAALRRALPGVGVAVAVAALVRLVYAPWYGNYDVRYALLWARDLAARSHARLRGRVRADAAPAVDRVELARGCRSATAPARRWCCWRWSASARSCGSCSGWAQELFTPWVGAIAALRRAHPAGDRARRAAGLPGRAVRGARDRRGAARGAAAAARDRRAGGARAGGAAAARGLGALGPLRAVPVARRDAARARAPDRAGRRGAGDLGAHRSARSPATRCTRCTAPPISPRRSGAGARSRRSRAGPRSTWASRCASR